jgi:multisubunit Na+/H+ antiporter MnhF subunit
MKTISVICLTLVVVLLIVDIKQGKDLALDIALFFAVLNWHVSECQIAKLKQKLLGGME